MQTRRLVHSHFHQLLHQTSCNSLVVIADIDRQGGARGVGDAEGVDVLRAKLDAKNGGDAEGVDVLRAKLDGHGRVGEAEGGELAGLGDLEGAGDGVQAVGMTGEGMPSQLCCRGEYETDTSLLTGS